MLADWVARPPEHRFACMLDPTPHAAKPEGMAGAVRSRMRAVEMSERQLCDALERGMSVQFGVTDGTGSRSGNWVSQQCAALDFDNKREVRGDDGRLRKCDLREGEPGYMDPLDALQRCYDHGLPPLALYFTFSATLDHPRFRIVFLLSEPVRDPALMREANLGLLRLFPEADRACKDLVRLYFGSNGEVWECWACNGGEACDVGRMASVAAPAREAAPRIRGRSRRLRRGEVRIEDACRDFDLLGLIRADAGEAGRAAGGRVDFPTCPICGHRGCLRYYPATNTYFCFSDAHPGNGGDVLAYLMERDGIAYPDAKRMLGDLIG